MNKQDLNQIRTIVKEEVSTIVKEEVTTIVKEEVSASEKRLEKRLSEEIGKSEKRVLGEIGKFVEDQLLPLIEEKADKSDIDRLERKIDHITGKVSEHDVRITRIESVPVVAHELKHKKAK